MSRRNRVLAALTAVILVLSACASHNRAQTSTGDGHPAQVDRIRLAAGNDGFPSPITGHRLAAVQASLMFDTLVWKDSTGAVIPWLASSWDRSADGTEWTFHIRDGVRWQDNTPLTAADVAFTYNYLISGPGLAAAGLFGSVWMGDFIDVRATAADTVVFRFKRPWATFLAGVAGLIFILPEHIWAKVTDPARFVGPQSVIGSGPYRLASFDQASGSAAFVANDSFSLGRPYVRRIEFVPAPDELLALQHGDIDAANAGAEDQVPAQALKAFSSSRYATVAGPNDWNRVLHFNLTRGFPYDDVRFRQAIAYAIDRKDMVNRILFGRGLPGSPGGLSPASSYFAPDLPAYDRDLGKARALLDAAGLKDLRGDGKRDLPDGQPFVMQLQTSTEFSTKAAELVSEYLRQVGIGVDITALDPTTADANALHGNYDAALIGYSAIGGDPDIMMRIRLSPKAIPAVWKAKGYDNQAADALGLQQLFTADDAPRKDLVRQIQHIVADDVPFIPLYMPTPSEIFVRTVFSAWYFTPEGFLGGYSGVVNKQAFVTGKKVGI
jgi:peptide/nickel transport system substrate-binding protein